MIQSYRDHLTYLGRGALPHVDRSCCTELHWLRAITERQASTLVSHLCRWHSEAGRSGADGSVLGCLKRHRRVHAPVLPRAQLLWRLWHRWRAGALTRRPGAALRSYMTMTCLFKSVEPDQQTKLTSAARRCLSVLALLLHTSTARMARCPSPFTAMAQLTRVGVAHVAQS
jgi:hypothetical protein